MPKSTPLTQQEVMEGLAKTLLEELSKIRNPQKRKIWFRGEYVTATQLIKDIHTPTERGAMFLTEYLESLKLTMGFNEMVRTRKKRSRP